MPDSGAIISGPKTFFVPVGRGFSPIHSVSSPVPFLLLSLDTLETGEGVYLPLSPPPRSLSTTGRVDPLGEPPNLGPWSLGASAHDIIQEKLNRHRAYREPCTATHPCCLDFLSVGMYRISHHVGEFSPSRYNPYLITALNALDSLENSSKFELRRNVYIRGNFVNKLEIGVNHSSQFRSKWKRIDPSSDIESHPRILVFVPLSTHPSVCVFRPFLPLNHKSLWTAAGPSTARCAFLFSSFEVQAPFQPPRNICSGGDRRALPPWIPTPSSSSSLPRLSVCTTRFNGTLNRNKT